jgi:pimeloyl-ACP methyl ester carboxylesterase
MYLKTKEISMKTIQATLHDGAQITATVSGSGPAILLAVDPVAATGAAAAEKQKWGMDPALGRHFIEGLDDAFTVIAFDYEGFRMQHPAALTLTPDNIAKDFLAIADAAGVDSFAYYGYSWLGLSALQLGIRTKRLWALVMGGFPPIDGPYGPMLTVTQTTHDMTTQPQPKATTASSATPADDGFDWDAVDMSLSSDQTQQFVTLYEALKNFDDRSVQNDITCPRLCFAGSKDSIEYGERWGDVTVDIASPLIHNADELKHYGWDVAVLEGLEHTGAMQPANVLPIIKPWLRSIVDAR